MDVEATRLAGKGGGTFQLTADLAGFPDVVKCLDGTCA